MFNPTDHIFELSKCLAVLSSATEESSDLISVAIHCVSLEGDHPRQMQWIATEMRSDSSWAESSARHLEANEF